MKVNKFIYYVSTGIVSLMAISAGIMYFSNPEIAVGFGHLGFPDYFRKELGIAKILGATLIIVPKIPTNVREWVYAGFGITFFSAILSHASVDGIQTGMAPIFSLVFLTVSYIFWKKSEVKVVI